MLSTLSNLIYLKFKHRYTKIDISLTSLVGKRVPWPKYVIKEETIVEMVTVKV